jgi:hypothetical protein
MNSTTTKPSVKIPDPAFKYPFCYGLLSGDFQIIRSEVRSAETSGCKTVSIDFLKKIVAHYEAVDDALHAELKN